MVNDSPACINLKWKHIPSGIITNPEVRAAQVKQRNVQVYLSGGAVGSWPAIDETLYFYISVGGLRLCGNR